MLAPLFASSTSTTSTSTSTATTTSTASSSSSSVPALLWYRLPQQPRGTRTHVQHPPKVSPHHRA
jgi:hypothetical protein